MRRLLILGLLLLTGCPEDTGEEPLPTDEGRVQGKLTPFLGSSSVGSTASRPALLQGQGAAELSRALQRARAQQQRLKQQKASLDVSQPDFPVIPTPPGPPPLKRLPAGDPTIIGDVIVRFEQAGVSAQRALEQVQVPGYRVTHKGYSSEYLHLVGFEALDGHALTVEETGQLVSQLAQVPGVRFTEKNLRMYPFRTPNDKVYSLQWHYSALNLPAAWDVSTGGSTVTVAVLDTGIVSHPDLTPRIVAGYDMVSDVSNAGDGNGRDSDPTDMGGDEPGGGSSWHGSHVAGTIGAATDNTSGVAGVTWTARIMPVRVLGKQGGTSADIAAAMTWATGGSVPGLPANPTPAKVVNMSLGGASAPSRTYQDVIDARVPAGAIFVIAAGNENTDAANSTPCNQQNVICVGSTNFAGKRSSFSNYGAPVDVMAAGGEMREDLNGDGYADGVLSTALDDNKQPAYVFNQGTSMATPHVSGVVALMAAVSADQGQNLTMAQAENILKATASPSSQCSQGCGAGLVNAQAALKALSGNPNDPPKLGVTTSLLSFRNGGTQQVLLSNLGGGSLKVTLAKSGTQASAVTLSTTTVTIPAFRTQTLDVGVNTGGLANGDYSATLTLTGTDANSNAAVGTATVAVKIRVGLAEDQDAFIAFAYQNSLGEWKVDDNAVAVVEASTGYQYSIKLSARTYYTLATIDDDNDGEFFEDGERTGFWRNVDDFEPIPLAAQQTITGISYDLVPLAPIDDSPALVVGSPCTSNADCPDGGRCVLSYPGGYCTRDCNTQSCPAGSKCYVVDQASDARVCIQSCSGPSLGQSNCRTSYVCYDDSAGGGQCLPNCNAYNICGSTPACRANGYCQ
ncbi:S8 family peptidase [Hyalangium minutum]|uniref:Extracellular serine protease n=1 Tax=Hyalangium minutum TaxID=394096 RepID=A0A085WUM3_9BACT|nr:S8 family peptidase [Hyalangium minutum]KFE71386.1 Extracellular serine protease [Hyalangium minutum]